MDPSITRTQTVPRAPSLAPVFARRVLALLGLVVLFASTPASAGLNFFASASTSDGSPLDAMTPGASLVIEISVTSSLPNEVLGLSASVSGYDPSVFALDEAASTVADALFYPACFPSFGCAGDGLDNGRGVGPEPLYEEILPSGEGRAVFFDGLSLTPAAGDGTAELAFSGPQFTLVFERLNCGPGNFTIGVETSRGDFYLSASGDDTVNNSGIHVTPCPEPGTALLLGIGLGGLALRRPDPR